MNIIDPHLHLFNLELGDYHWLQPTNSPHWPDKGIINKSFTEADLQLAKGLNLAGFVHIEAGFNNQQPELELAMLAEQCTLPFKSIAFADITGKNFADKINTLQQYSAFIGVRHILDEQAIAILSQPRVLQNLKHLEKQQLIFELQCDCSDNAVIELLVSHLQQVPNLALIIEHCGMSHSNTVSKNLRYGLTALASFEHCFIKCSGWEMRDRSWQFDQALLCISQIIDIFAEARVMLASNFPLSLFSSEYQQLWQNLRNAPHFSEQTVMALCYQNANRIYQLNLS
ncbi:amidohydrolase family protein [Thalassotalea sp. ND16A]|uniref:amidohydrolase family protein n=1 Tax=Thalassotalea sp. ND16A TaxID=1535422 RepID=UPI00051A6D96|nr:amidohydrolase family protein [Thalassotalea sp. ND16A]KGJ89217.1 hypothetical protein ND16A_2110 [Thalassotalea sp. ND16A]